MTDGSPFRNDPLRAAPTRRSAPLSALCAGALLLVGFAALSAPAAAQNCGIVSYRLWQPQNQTWYGNGETVQIGSGEEGHIYVHVAGRSSNPYGTVATFAYPNEFGYDVRSQDVARHVTMKAQNGQDRQSGRIRFTASQPGTTYLAFRIDDVQNPGRLDSVPPKCRIGLVPIQVVGRGAGGLPPSTGGGRPGGGRPGGPGGGWGGGQGGGGGSYDAARSVVDLLERGLLRRVQADPNRGFVDDVARNGRDGILRVAETMVDSEEFRRRALQRTEERHGRGSLNELRDRLLSDIYRDLYGYVEPSRDDANADYRDLETCLSTDRRAGDACRRFGREVVGRRAFYDQNARLIDQLR